MYGLNREGVQRDVTLGIDHYAVQGAVGLALPVVAATAALRPGVRRLLAISAGVVASYLGLVSFAWSDAAGALGRPWSVAAMAWGGALAVAVLVPRSGTAPVRST